jgi:quinol monooxygenase YgiN
METNCEEPPMILIHCRFVIADEDLQAWTDSARRMAIASRKIDGCLDYNFSFDIFEPNVAYLYEAWESPEALDAHRARPHFSQRVDVLKDLKVEGQQLLEFGVAWRKDMAMPNRNDG